MRVAKLCLEIIKIMKKLDIRHGHVFIEKHRKPMDVLWEAVKPGNLNVVGFTGKTRKKLKSTRRDGKDGILHKCLFD